ncbi:MAG: isochorismatase family protein [Actinobacteria bacterium]|nr:isochorismatase family protein [Actinomycetota bacterium]
MASVAYDPQTALVVLDVQNDFASPDGSLYVLGGEEVVPVIDREIERAKASGAGVVYTADWHPESTPHFEKDGGIWPVHCVGDTWGAEFHPGLVVDGPVVRKGENGEDGYSGFTMRDPLTHETVPTELPKLLADVDVTRLVVVGLATDYCVRFTVLDALAQGYPVRLLAEATRAVNLEEGDGDGALAEVEAAGCVIV